MAPHRDLGPPAPIESIEVVHPEVPAAIEGLRILHLTDLHVRRPRRPTPGGRSAWDRLLFAVAHTPADLVVYTGDCIDEVGHEAAGLDALKQLSDAIETHPPRLGQWGIFGNHDTPVFRSAARHAQAIRWMDRVLTPPLTPRGGGAALPLRLLGLSWPEDPLAALLEAGPSPVTPGQFVLGLVHYPSVMVTLADVAVPLVLAGHTHAGQIRLHPRLAPHTSCDLPTDLASGMLRIRGTLGCIARGVGEGFADGLRVNCPAQAPLYTLRRGPMPGRDSEPGLHMVKSW